MTIRNFPWSQHGSYVRPPLKCHKKVNHNAKNEPREDTPNRDTVLVSLLIISRSDTLWADHCECVVGVEGRGGGGGGGWHLPSKAKPKKKGINYLILLLSFILE